ncbi:zinc finger BED domain-containing protein 5-like [Tiliqua scincoides]|uniref:zinc finger BED domain-containing protein 5-like n=1 Tax=Tiliqua scincoides TaxID=71010 RepID=UPI00346367C9
MDSWLVKKTPTTVEIHEDEPSTSSNPPKQRKVMRKYEPRYLKIGFTWNGDEEEPRPQCVVCCEVFANESMCPDKLRQHIETKHPHLQNQPLKFFKTKLDELEASKRKLLRITKTNKKALHTSYLISLHIAKAGKPHTFGQSLALPAIKDKVGIMFGDKSSKEVETIPLSNNTLDETTDVGDLCQLLVFVRYIWNNEPHEDMLCCEPILQGSSEEIFNILDTYVKKKGLDWIKCVGLCTDGARAVCGKKSSVVTQVLEVCPDALWTHCNIHREVLVSKSMPDNLKNVLNTSIKIVNFIKTRPSQSCLFEKVCEEMGSTHKSLLLHTDSRWLSKGKVLTRLVELREETAMFLDEKNDLAEWLRNKEFVLQLTYLADIFSKLNELNLYLQKIEGADIFVVHDEIQGFIKKLVLWKKSIEDYKYDCFETFQTFITENDVKPPDGIIMEISAHLNALSENLDYYFFEGMKNCQQKNWIANPFQDDMMTGISAKADEELIDLSENTLLKLNFNRRQLTQFWLSVQQTFPTLSTEALKVLLPFSSSYTCEVGFSAMMELKNKSRNKQQLSNSLRLKITNINVDVNAVINSNRKQAHPSHRPRYKK